MQFWAYNFNNIEVRAVKCLPLKSPLNFDRDSINKAFLLLKFVKKIMIYEFQAILSL